MEDVEVVELPQMNFVCSYCHQTSRIVANLAGRVTRCVHCDRQSGVPEAGEDAAMNYGVSSAPTESLLTPIPMLDASRPDDDDWCAPGYDTLPKALRNALDGARGLANQRKWLAASQRLARLFKTVTGRSLSTHGELQAESLPIRRPLAFCLYQHAMIVLHKENSHAADFSPPGRELLGKIQRHRRVGLSFQPTAAPFATAGFPT